VGCNTPPTNLDATTRILRNIKDKQADLPANKTRNNLPHPCVAAVELPWLETTHLQKHFNMQNILRTVTEHSM